MLNREENVVCLSLCYFFTVKKIQDLQLSVLLAADGVQYWETVRHIRPVWDRWSRAKSSDIELNSYALLIYLHRGLIIESQRIANWLMSQRNANGGFSSTQVEVSFSELYVEKRQFFLYD